MQKSYFLILTVVFLTFFSGLHGQAGTLLDAIPEPSSLKQEHVLHIRGIVSAFGMKTLKSSQHEREIWFSLEHWKFIDSEQGLGIGTRKVHLKVSESEFVELAKVLRPYSIHDFNVRSSTSMLHDELVKVHDSDTIDADLLVLQKKLQARKTIQDDVFGTILSDVNGPGSTAETLWGNQLINVGFCPDEASGLPETLATAKELLKKQRTWDEKLRIFAEQDLREGVNENRQEWEGGALSAEQFKSLMYPDGVLIYPEGSFEFYYWDSEMLGGHWIAVSGTLAEGPQSVNTPD